MACSTLGQLYSQSARGRGLVVSERLWFVCILNGSSLDFYDLAATPPQHDVASAFKFLCSERQIGDAPATVAALSLHDPSILAVGTASGVLAFLRLRRTATSPSSVFASTDKITPHAGPLLVHKVLETKLDSAESAITCICFHPRRRGLCAVACGGRVYLVQHDLGLLATAECCDMPGAPQVSSIAWCGPLLACGDVDGVVRIWRLSVTLVDPRTPAVPLGVEAECIGALPPPSNAPRGAVSTMRWLALDKADGADAADGAERRAKKRSDAPLGVLCCGYASKEPSTSPSSPSGTQAHFRSWSISKAGEVFMLASLPVAPLKGAHKLVLSDVLAPRPLGSEGVGGGEGSRVDEPDSSSPAAKCGADTAPHSPYTTALRRQPSMMTAQPLMARSFRPASAPRWLLCGASGSPAVFALPWGRASDDDEAEATFPTAVELLNEPSTVLEPTPQHGVVAMHHITSNACREHFADAFGIGSERAYFSGPGASATCELVLVLSDMALHVILHSTRPTGANDATLASPNVQPVSDLLGPNEARSLLGPNEAPSEAHRDSTHPLEELQLHGVDSTPAVSHVPLISHLLREARPDSAPAADAAASSGDEGNKGTAVPAAESTSALYARIHELEQRAQQAEQRLVELQTSFGLFAAQSRQQTNQLLGALDRLVADHVAST